MTETVKVSAEAFAAAEWQRFGEDDGSGVVEVATAHVADATFVALRNSAEPERLFIFDEGEWTAFVEGAKDGEFDLLADQPSA